MHEWQVSRAILQHIKEYAAQSQFIRIKSITLALGKLSCIDQAALAFNFSIVSQGGVADKAALKFIDVSPVSRCHTCQQTFNCETLYTICPFCHSAETELIQGQELNIQSIEVEKQCV